jgi:hypothetical protein
MLVSAFTSYHLKKARLPSSSRRGRACLPVGRGGPKTDPNSRFYHP